MREGLTFDDVLLVPQPSPVASRSDVDLSTEILPGISLDVPILSTSMDTVTEAEMAQAMADAGGCGIIHRFQDPMERIRMASEVDGTVGAALGLSTQDYSALTGLEEAGVDFVCIDVAHGHLERAMEVTREVSKTTHLPVMAGAVATGSGVKDLANAGADSIRVGVGPGSACTTRNVAGAGVPQLTALQDASSRVETLKEDVTIVADGGIKNSGDITKALMAGADAVLVGGLLAGTEEAAGETIEKDGRTYKEYRGMASEDAQNSHNGKPTVVEGGKYLKPVDGTAGEVVAELASGIRSGLSYCGGHTIEEARENAEFIKVSPSTKSRNGVHGGQ